MFPDFVVIPIVDRRLPETILLPIPRLAPLHPRPTGLHPHHFM